MHATGVVQETGKKFWSTHDAGQKPFEYQVRRAFDLATDSQAKLQNCRFEPNAFFGRNATFRKAGVGGVITGWDQGCLGMKVGEERLLVIPAEEGYGAKGKMREWPLYFHYEAEPAQRLTRQCYGPRISGVGHSSWWHPPIHPRVPRD